MFEVQRAQQIVMPEGEVAKITDSSGSIIWQKCEHLILPQSDDKKIPVEAIKVSSGDIITIYYYLTTASGTVYDGSNCGCNSFTPSASDINIHGAKTITATKAGTLIIAGKYSNYQWGIDWPGSFAISPPYGDYIRIKIN